jgi:hypothetical protein
MPLTAENSLGTTTAALRLMTAESQLDYVKKYMMQYQGKMHTLEDVYMAILYPADIGQPASTAVFSSGTRAYQQNKGFDKNSGGNITISEISATVYHQYRLGMEKGNFG